MGGHGYTKRECDSHALILLCEATAVRFGELATA